MLCNGCECPPELYYDQEFQVWLREDSDGSLVIGMTDISQVIAGRILHVRVRRPGTERQAGKPVATIESGKWAGPIPNYFDCVILEANEAVLDDPSLLNTAPYQAWVARVKPGKGVQAALSGMLTGQAAVDGFCARAKNEDINCGRDR